MSESTIQSLVMRAIGSQPDMRIFRNQVGLGWVGQLVSHEGGTVVLAHPRRVSMGLTTGSADLIGWYDYVIQPEDVGRQAAVFLSVEIKRPGERPKPHQLNWAEQVTKHGGIHLLATDPKDIHKIDLWKPKPL